MRHKHVFTLYWMLLAAGIVIGAFLLWHLGMFHRLIESDVSRLSSVMIGVFLIASCHAAVQVFRISGDSSELEERDRQLAGLPPDERLRLLSSGQGIPARLREPLSKIAQRCEISKAPAPPENSMLIQNLDRHVRAPVRLGWLLSDLLIKLGLLGTVIGFILMLGAISGGDSVDISNIDGLLAEMGSGMRVALFTTLTGLTTGTLLGFQYFIVDRSADVLMARVTELVEIRVPGGTRGA